MKKLGVFPTLLLLILTIACSQHRANTPDPKDNVVNSLKSHGYNEINVAVDRGKGAVTVEGDLKTAERKSKGGKLARAAAPGTGAANESGVRPDCAAGSAMKKGDSNTAGAIQTHMTAAIAPSKW